MSSFTNADLELLKLKNINIETIENQLKGFKTGFPFAQLMAAATPQRGIVKLQDAQLQNHINRYNIELQSKNVLKFVPASGAASRMFKDLFEFREDLATSNFYDLVELQKHKSVKHFFDHLDQFAFYNELLPYIQNYMDEDKNSFATACLDFLLEMPGLNYANKPKALLLFHKYPGFNRLSIEEHLVEASDYCKTQNQEAFIHFTVSPDHIDAFKSALNSLVPQYEMQLKIKFNINYSVQKSSTDTIAADQNNEAFRDENGKLVFRPGGHGALIENLNDLTADLIFIKNIDNVVYDSKRQSSIDYKKALASIAFELHEEISNHLQQLMTGSLPKNILDFIKNTLLIDFDKNRFDNQSDLIQGLMDLLNRPLRVCGMVKNEGEPGGGPFYVKKGNETSLQIVESAEIDQNNTAQKSIMQNATHFNPVDLVCITNDWQGNKFDLRKFVDPNSAFISEKSKDGKVLKAMELPGLWNGAMAFWTTVFVEVPIETFNPVKTVNDLLRPMHRGF